MRSSILVHPGASFSRQHTFHSRFAPSRGYCGQKEGSEGFADERRSLGQPPQGGIHPVDRKQAKSFWMKKE
jgi:hypothetical protein